MNTRHQLTVRLGRSFGRFLLFGVILSGLFLSGLFVPPSWAEQPIPQIEAGGPSSYVTSLAFSPDGLTLYAAGWDKTVQVWRRAQPQARFQPDPVSTYRVPLGPGLNGAINALAVSPDGRWLAAAGRSVVAGGSGFRDLGRVIPATAMSPDMKRDQGTIYLFDTRTREVRTLVGHHGEVLALTFAAGSDRQPYLVSAARERDYRPGRENQETGVVRFWNVLQEDPAAGRVAAILLPLPTARPVLTAWRTGPGEKGFHVAIAWGDRQLRLWDLARNRLTAEETGGANDNVMAPLRQGLLMAGQTRGADGRLGTFSIGADGRLRASRPWSDEAFRLRDNLVRAPRLAVATSSTPEGSPDLAAIVVLRGRLVRQDGQDHLNQKTYELHLVRLDGNRFGQSAASVPLWSGEGRFQPTLAVSPQGTLAVGGNEQQTIQLFDVRDLLLGAGPMQQLRGAGIPLAKVEFAAGGNQTGLRLEPRSDLDGRPGAPLLLDIQRRRLEPWPADGAWRTATRTRGDWRVQVPGRPPAGSAGAGQQVVILRGGNVWRRIPLEPGRELTAHAFTEADEPPLLALATRGDDEVQLAIYDAFHGQLVRQCTAHTLPIHSLQFSPDARLLASAGDDGIACIWSLVDLKTDTLGRRGAPGVELQRGGQGELEVRAAPAELREFQVGDVIQGALVQNDFLPWEKLGDAYEAAWRRRPGETITVRRLRAGRTEDVPLPIVQGVDERKPLFSLFVARDQHDDFGGMAGWSWIAFSPLGPFDSSNSDAERFLGWHINTGNPQTPTSFARADQYREQYRQEGLMARLWEQGRLAQLEPTGPLPRPNLTLSFPDQQEPGELFTALQPLRQIPDSIQLSVHGLASEQIDRVTLWAGDQEVGPFEELFDHQWSADLSGLDWSQGKQQLRASLVTREPVPQTFHATIEAVYYPPAPRIVTDVPSSRLTAEQQFDPQFRIAAAKQDEEVEWSILHRHGDDVTTVAEGRAMGEATIQPVLLQRPGENRFELVVSNSGTDPQRSPRETTRRRFSTTFQPEVAAPSLVTIQHVELLDQQGRATRVDVEPGSVVTTSDPHLRVVGGVITSRTPRRGTWSLGSQQGELTLHEAGENEPVRWETSEAIELQPGEQSVSLAIELSDSESLTVELPVEYLRRLPEINMLAPLDGQEFVEGQEEPVAVVQAEFHAADPRAFTASLFHNGREAKELTIDATGRISGSVSLIAGENQLQIRLQARDEEAFRETTPIVVLYRRPPQVNEVQATPPGDSPFIDLSVRGTSIHPPSRLEIFAGPRRIRTVAESQISWRRDENRWNATVAQLPLVRGTNTFRVVAQSQDGRSLQPGVVEVEFLPAPPPLAEVQFLAPASDSMTTEAEFTAVLLARSKSPLRQIRMSHNGEEVQRNEDLRDLRASREGWFEHEQRVTVNLTPGANFFEGFVVNEGGEESSEARITYHFRPVRMEILAMSGGGRAGIPPWRTTPRSGTGVDVVFDEPAQTGHVQIHGRVIWERPDARQTRRRMPVHVWVNGFHQAPVQLETLGDDSNQRHFIASVVLNKSEANRIELKLPKLSTEADCPLEFTVACQDPVLDRRLHLAIIGVGVTPEQTSELERRALEAFQASRSEGKRTEFETPAFQRGWVYGPITGERVNRYRIQGMLDQIKQTVNNLSRSDPMNDVIVIYYEGGEIVYEEEQFYLTTKEATAIGDLSPDIVKLSSVGSRLLSEFFASMGGAHLMFLDVVRGREGLTQPAVLPNDQRTALLRFAWLRDVESPQEASLILAVRNVLAEDDADIVDLNAVVQRIGDQFIPEENVLVSRRFGESLIFQQRVPAVIAELIMGRR